MANIPFLNNAYFSAKVGIGTDSPGAKLEVTSQSQTLPTAKFDSIELQTYTVNNSWVGENLYYDGSFKYRADGYATALYFDGSGFDIRTAPNGPAGTVATLTTRFTILESNGNVGIGTTGPAYKLDVDETTSGNLIVSRFKHNQSGVASAMQLENRAGGVNSAFDINWGLNSSGNQGTVGVVRTNLPAAGGSEMYFKTSYGEVMRLDGDGNVGIGTTDPGAKLEVSSATGGILRLTSTDTAIATGDFIGKIEFKSNDASTGGNNVMGFISSVARNVGTRYALSFGTGDAAAAVERMRIENDGDVIIGGATPSAKLNIDGANEGDSYLLGGTGNARQLRFSTFATASPHAGHKIDATSINGAITLATGGSERMRVDSAGAIKFNDYGSGNKTGDVDYLLGVNSSGTILEANTATLPGGPYLPLSAGSGFPLTDSLFIRGDDKGLVVQNAASTINVTVGAVSSSAVSTGLITLRHLGVSKIVLNANDNSYFTGNVGIGTTSPIGKLDISDGTNPLSFDSSTYNEIQSYNRPLLINRQGNNVGIGTTSPAYPLDVSGIIKTSSSFLGTTAIIQKVTALNANGIQFTNNGGSEKMRITDGGNVGIGTTSPLYKLDVSGSIRAGGKLTYEKSAGSLSTTGYAVAGLLAGSNGNSCMFTFTAIGNNGQYQKVVYSCWNAQGTWNTSKVIDEGTNKLDIEASANASTITFTFKSRSGSLSYTPRVTVEASGSAINSTYA